MPFLIGVHSSYMDVSLLVAYFGNVDIPLKIIVVFADGSFGILLDE